MGSIRTNGYSFCFGNIQDRGLETEHGKKLRLQADALRLEGGRPDGLQQAVLGEDMLCLQAGEGGLTLQAGNGISVQAPRVRVRTPLAINQNRLGEKGTGRKNPATGGGAYVTSQYEFSITSPLGELVGLEYEEYNPFEDEIAYESYEAVEKRRLEVLFKGIATVLTIGAAVVLVAVTGGAALGGAMATGAVVAGVGSAVAVATYMHDKENSTASSAGTYIRNSGTASLITAMVIGSFWAAPYAAKALALQETGGLPFTMLFGKLVALEEVNGWMQIGTEALALLNAFFQTNELLAFFGGTKELGDETGCAAYDETKMLVEGYSVQFLLMGFEQWLKERELKKVLDSGDKKTGGKINTSWYKEDGSMNYPPNNGAVPGTEVDMTLQPGDIIGRYGYIGDKSNFVTQAGADPSKLSLPPNTDPSIYQEFIVIKEIPGTRQAEILGWGGSEGGGLQYELPMPILQLFKEGYIIPK